MTDLKTLTDEQIGQLRADVTAEFDRRRALAAAAAAVTKANLDYLAAEGTKDGDPWRQPTGSHDTYPAGWRVSHGDREWEAVRSGAMGTPGQSPDWREVAG